VWLQLASTGDDQGRGQRSFLPLDRTGLQGPILLFHLWQRKASFNGLMVATQQVWENHDMGALDKERMTMVLDLQKVVVASYSKLL
jgi:hypothetical protein